MYATEEYVDSVEARLDMRLRSLKADIRAVGDTSVQVLEGQQRLEARVGHVESKVDRLETKVDRIDGRLDGLETRFDGLETRLDSFESKVDANLRAIMQHLGVAEVEVVDSPGRLN